MKKLLSSTLELAGSLLRNRWVVLVGTVLLVGGITYFVFFRKKNPTGSGGLLGGVLSSGNEALKRLTGSQPPSGWYGDTAKLKALEIPYEVVKTPGVMEWGKHPKFRLRDDEEFIWDADINNPGQVDEMLERGVTRIHQDRLRKINRRDVPAKHRYIIATRNAFGPQIDVPNPDLSVISEDVFVQKLDEFLGGQKDFSDGQVGKLLAVNFEVGNDASGPYVQKWGNILHKLLKLAREKYGITHPMSFDLHQFPTGTPGVSSITPQWGAFRAAGINAAYVNPVSYIRLDLYYGDNGVEYAVNEQSQQAFVQERKATEYKWFAKLMRGLENHLTTDVPTLGFITPGWQQSGYPESQNGALRPDMYEVFVVFGMLSGMKGPANWQEGTAYKIVQDYHDAQINALARMSLANDLRGPGTTYVPLEVSVDGGASWHLDTPEQAEAANRPTARGRVKGNDLLVGVYDPQLFAGTRPVLIKYGDFVDAIELKPYRVFTGRKKM